MSTETIRALLDAFDSSDWQEMTVTVGADRLHVSRDPAVNTMDASPERPASPAPLAPAPPVAAGDAVPPPAIPAPPAPIEPPASGLRIESPSVGLFWRAPSPGAPPFVEEGSRVSAGETVAIVEVMKLMNHVTAPVDGVVTAILVENGAPVEYGQEIVVVDPEA